MDSRSGKRPDEKSMPQVDEPMRALKALAPPSTAAHRDAFVSRTLAAAAAELERRSTSVLWEVGQWSRSLLAAAALIVIVSLAALTLDSPTTSKVSVAGADVADVIGIPASLARWTRTNIMPSPADLVVTLAKGAP